MDIPTLNTVLYGRDSELQQIVTYLDDPGHRLVTLVGPGGIGKTCLAIEAARRYGDRTKDGAVFVDLQAVEQSDLVIQRLADSLQLAIQDSEPAVSQVIRFLQGKETLIFFDNFEQVVDAAPLVGQLLVESPGTTALITSRTPLRIRQEWVLHVDGLPVPDAEVEHTYADEASTQLFVDRATKIRTDLQVQSELPAIERVCRLVEGMPLAIELAASWAHVLDCSEIADELERSHTLLETEMRDVPERHRSIEAIFQQSMSMLPELDRQVFGRLTIFRGGFTRDAAIKVAGANLGILSSLVNRSLIRPAGSGRYRIHELVRQHGAEDLATDEGNRSSTERAHCDYYMELLASLRDDLTVARQVEAVAEVDAELENVRTAWNFAVENLLAPLIAYAATAYGQFIQYRGQYAVAGRTFADAVKVLESAEQTTEVQKALALVLIEHGRFSLRQGHMSDAQSAYERSAALHQALDMEPEFGFLMDPQLGFAYIESTRGNIDSAIDHATESLERAQTQRHRPHVAMANQLLGHLALRKGDLENARRFDQTAMEGCIEQGERWFLAYCYNELGEVEVAEGRYSEASELFQQSLEISTQFSDRANMGLAHTYLGEVASLAGDYENARLCFEESRSAYEQLGDRGGSTRVQSGLGLLAVSLGDFATAAEYLSQVLDTGLEMQYPAMILCALEGAGELALKNGQRSQGVPLLEFVASHPSTEARTSARLTATAEHIEPAKTQVGSLEEYVSIARDLLDNVRSETTKSGLTVVGTAATTTTSSTQALPDPLTDRELEILDLVARGYPNKQIADELFITLGTVKWYNNQIYTKLGVHNRTGAVSRARQLELIES